MANPNYDDTIVVQDRGNSDFLAGLIASGPTKEVSTPARCSPCAATEADSAAE